MKFLPLAVLCFPLVLMAGDGKKEQFPAQRTPAVLFTAPGDWERTTSDKNGSAMLRIISQQDKTCGMSVGVVKGPGMADLSYRKIEGDFLSKVMPFKSKEKMGDVEISGFKGKTFGAVWEIPGDTVTGRMLYFRLDATHSCFITTFHGSKASGDEQRAVEIFVKSQEIAGGPGGAAAQPAPDERVLELNEQGRDAMDKSDWGAVIATEGDLLKINPQDAKAYYNRSRAYYSKNDLDKCLADVNEAIRLDPHYADAYNTRGIIFEEQGEGAKAIADFTEAIRLAPKYPAAYDNRAQAFIDTGEFDKAIADASQAILLQPGYSMAYLHRAMGYYGKKDMDEAMKDSKAAIAADPKNAFAYDGLATVYGQKGDYKNAILQLNEAIWQNGKVPNFYHDRGWAKNKAGDYAGALEDYTRLVELLPASDAHGLNSLAWQLATCPDPTMRDGKKAVDYAQKACEASQWKEANDVDTLAAAYAESGDFDKAVKYEEWYLALPGAEAKDLPDAKARLELYQAHKAYHEEKKQ